MLYPQMNFVQESEYFSNKNLSELTIRELVYFHLDINSPRNRTKDGFIASSLYDLKESLSASFINRRTCQYVPLMVSFSILDQLGSLYSVQGIECNYENGIKRALHYFSNCGVQEIKSLVTLRNGLLHDGSLISHNRDGRTHVFYRMVKESGRLLTPPKITWDGEYRDDLTNYITLIDLKELQAVVLKAIGNCLEHLLQQSLEVKALPEREFFFKYMFKQDL